MATIIVVVAFLFTEIIQEVFHVYLNKFEIAVSPSFLIIFSNNKFTFNLVNLISRNAQPPRKYLLALFAGLKQSQTEDE